MDLNQRATPERKIRMLVAEGFPEELPTDESVELLRVLQEALTNARRHSAARNVQVRLGTEEEHLLLEIADDGRGFDIAAAKTGVGLSAMRERVDGLGGTLAIRARPGEGTKVVVRVPLRGGTPDPRRL